MSDSEVPMEVAIIDKAADKENKKKGKENKKTEDDDDDEDEEEDEYDDAHGSNVVATLCRKVKPPIDDNDLVIAVVVSSKGDRRVAQACATAHITKLKRRFNDENNSFRKCKIIAGMNQKESKDDTETHDNADGDDDVNDSTNTATGVEDDDDKSKGEQDTGSEEKKQYDPDEFMESFYSSKNTSFPLRGCVATEAQARSYLKQNAEALQKLSKDMNNMRTTWIIPHQSIKGPETDAISTYYKKGTIGDKTVVVVLSAFFLSTQDETQQTQQSKTKPTWLKQEKHILVCSIPELKQAAGSGQADDLANYKETFNQVKTFIEHYNNTVVDQGNNKLPKIERIALSYPPALYTNYKKLEAAKNKKKTTTKKTKPNIKQPKAHAKKKPSPSKAVKKPGAKPILYSHHSSASSGSSSGDGSGEDSDEDDDEVYEESQEGKGEDAYSVENDDWITALLEVLGGLKLDIYLMHDGNSNSPWQAPPDVITELDQITLTWKFPDCIDISDIPKSGEDEDDEDEDDKKQKIKLDDVPSTLFICDRQAGKRVGNDNSSTTTGGVFGSWVPMHYTAVRVVDTDKYSNASEINELIDVIYVKKQKKQ
jgi:hypothetical protein